MRKNLILVIQLSLILMVSWSLFGCGGGDSASSDGTSSNTSPVAMAGADISVAVGKVVTLDGDESSDPDGENLSYSWTIIDSPVGSSTNLSLANSASAVLVPDVAGQYIVQLIVNDGSADSAPCTVLVNASSATGILAINFGGDINPLDGGPDGFVLNRSAAGGNMNDAGLATALDQTGRIYVTGFSYNADRDCDMVLWRYTSDGSLDTTFGSGNGFVAHNNAAGGNNCDSGQAITLDQVGRIYVAGYSENAARNNDMVIWRFTSEGSLDTTFGNGAGFVVHDNAAGGNMNDAGLATALDQTGRIYVTGYSQNAARNQDMVVWRYTTSGDIDTSFGDGSGFVVYGNTAGGNGIDVGKGMKLDPADNIYIVGYSWNSASNYDMVVWRLTTSGSLDTSFASGNGFVVYDDPTVPFCMNYGHGITLDCLGRIYIVGYCWGPDGTYNMVVWRYTNSGDLDTSFGNGTGVVSHDNAAGGSGTDIGNSITLDCLGRIYIAGSSINSSRNHDMVVWRLTNEGNLDTTFGNGAGFVVHDNAAGGYGHDKGNSIILDQVGNILVAGTSTRVDGWYEMAVWKLN